MTHAPLVFSAEVARARANGRAIVALESPIITHGMPWPQNLETARAVEDEVRAGGAVPATIAVMRARSISAWNPRNWRNWRRRKG